MEKKKILIVDDEKHMRRLMAWTLESGNYAVYTAESGLAAIRYLERHDCDLLITDYKMPHMDGLELTRLIRTRDPSVPILVITGGASFDALIKKGATACLAKPFDADELLNIVRFLLDHE